MMNTAALVPLPLAADAFVLFALEAEGSVSSAEKYAKEVLYTDILTDFWTLMKGGDIGNDIFRVRLAVF